MIQFNKIVFKIDGIRIRFHTFSRVQSGHLVSSIAERSRRMDPCR